MVTKTRTDNDSVDLCSVHVGSVCASLSLSSSTSACFSVYKTVGSTGKGVHLPLISTW